MGFGAQAQSAAMKKQVLIAGGIAGLAAALGAVRADWEVRLFERYRSIQRGGCRCSIGAQRGATLAGLGAAGTLAGGSCIS